MSLQKSVDIDAEYLSSIDGDVKEVLVRLLPLINERPADEWNKDIEELKKIEVEVIDNLSENVMVNIYLDNQIYNGEEGLEGEHELCVEATDESGNKIVDKYNFKVNKNNIFCTNIKIKSSAFVAFIGISSIVVGLLKFKINRNLKTKYKES